MLPIPWMSPEAIAKKHFTQASDVWSYGIMVWEIFSYGATPYPGMKVKELVSAVVEGKRLDKPKACPRKWFRDLIQPCWKVQSL
jgi:serine/threonine protein kinase